MRLPYALGLVVVFTACALRHPADPVDELPDARALGRFDIPAVDASDDRPLLRDATPPDTRDAAVETSADDVAMPPDDAPPDDASPDVSPPPPDVAPDLPPDLPPPPPDVAPDLPPPPPDAPICTPGLSFCGGRCVNTANDLANCGGCGIACGSRSHVTVACAARCTYACEAGWNDCNGNPADGCECNSFCAAGICGPACGAHGQLCCPSLNPCASGQRCTGPWVPWHCCANNERWCGRCSEDC